MMGISREGLSPRVRGNRRRDDAVPIVRGSIPACAGEPDEGRRRQDGAGVYPRVCGGTWMEAGADGTEPGLSPRVRGNLGETVLDAFEDGSIPACAGEPPPSAAERWRQWVYPRVCGGTWQRKCMEKLGLGLSPRVRGNPRTWTCRSRRTGSIPACAGEPPWTASGTPCTRVYPRVCGGTGGTFDGSAASRGLSPRVRGNREQQDVHRVLGGSIPACAGEPP